MSKDRSISNGRQTAIPGILCGHWFIRLALVQRTSVLCCLVGTATTCFGAPLGTWKSVLSNPPAQLTGMAYGNGTFVGVGGGLSFVSHDATNWSTYATPTFMYQAGVAFGGGTFMAYGTNSPSPLAYICASGDGMSWRTVFPNVQANTKKIYAAAYGNNTWAFLAYINDANGVLAGNATSATNWNWTQVSLGQNTLSSLYFLNGTFVLQDRKSVM